MENKKSEYRIVTMYTSQSVPYSFTSLNDAREKSRSIMGDFAIWEVQGEEVKVVFSTV